MGRTYDEIDDRLAGFIAAQPVVFVGTAPLASDGHLNVSPKGLRGTLAVLGPHTIAYLDLTGSGIETVAHLRENGRIILMFCSFEGPPRIVRMHGRGEAIFRDDRRWNELASRFPTVSGARSVIVVDVTRISDSCGYGVPLMSYSGDRDQLSNWADRKGPDGIEEYWSEKNATSIDGLPGMADRGAPSTEALVQPSTEPPREVLH